MPGGPIRFRKPRAHSELAIDSAEQTGQHQLERFPAKWVPVRVKKARQNKKLEPPFRFNRNGKGSS